MKPATPLPWQDNIAFGDEIASIAANRAYAVHAANAYQRLVEALLDLADYGDDGLNRSDAQRILRELGELK